jgi:Fe-S cluster assembly ATPase SufC
VPDVVHVLRDGRIERSGDRHLAREIEANGFGPDPELAPVAR